MADSASHKRDVADLRDTSTLATCFARHELPQIQFFQVVSALVAVGASNNAAESGDVRDAFARSSGDRAPSFNLTKRGRAAGVTRVERFVQRAVAPTTRRSSHAEFAGSCNRTERFTRR